jgi:hypothetical protein
VKCPSVWESVVVSPELSSIREAVKIECERMKLKNLQW